MTKMMAMWTTAIVGGLLPSRCRAVAAAALLGLALCCAAWAQQPEPRVTQTPRVAPPQAVWTPMSRAPAGLLTALEGGHHDEFIERARAGDIDIVLFGMTETEMWNWPDRGRSVWDRTLGLRKAANFGSQGTRFESLLWRMQNGELDGYQAKLVVLQGFGGTGDQAMGAGAAEFVAGFTPIIAEIRARQPQAKILLSAAFPRGQLDRAHWREVAEQNAAVYRKLADEQTVFYVDIGERFFLPDGSHNQEMWTMSGPPNAGIQEPAFKVWAEGLQPWLDRFVR
jgi:GDSL-like Lipase/Acylhydrolase family